MLKDRAADLRKPLINRKINRKGNLFETTEIGQKMKEAGTVFMTIIANSKLLKFFSSLSHVLERCARSLGTIHDENVESRSESGTIFQI